MNDMWDYRIIRRADSHGVYQVYYDLEGNPLARTPDPASLQEMSLHDLREDLAVYFQAAQKPILDDTIFR